MTKEEKRIYDQDWRRLNKNRTKERDRRNRIKNGERIRERERTTRVKNRERYFLIKAKGEAKRRNIPFSLTKEDITIPERCSIFGIPLFWTPKKKADNTPSLDKIIPRLGYVKGNIQIISWKANRIKSDATLNELIKIGEWAKSQLS